MTWMVIAYYISAGAVLMLALLGLNMVITISYHRLHALLLVLAAVLIVFYQHYTVQYHLADTVEDAVWFLRQQTTVAILAIPVITLFALSYTRRLIMWRSLWFLVPSCGVLLLLNYISPYTVRFQTVEGLVPIMAFEGLSRLNGQIGLPGLAVHLFAAGTMFAALLDAAWRLRFDQPELSRRFWIAALLLGVNGLWGLGLDAGNVPGLYAAGFAISAIVIVVIQGVVREFQKARNHAERAEVALSRVALGISRADGEAFFKDMVRSVSDLIAVRHVFLGMVDTPRAPRCVKVLAHARDGRLETNEFSYDIKNTPAQVVVNDDICYIRKGVLAKYPCDVLLREMKVDGYVGFAVKNSDGDVAGIFTLLHDKPIRLTNPQKHILSIFVARASAELGRIESERKMRRMAYEDYLTGLANRAAFFEELHQRLLTIETDATGLLILLDIDQFKHVNETKGQTVGDTVLRLVGRRFANADLPAFCAKLGGDEFAFIAHTTSKYPGQKKQSEELEALIRQQFEADFLVGNHAISLECSLGVTFFKALEKPFDVMQRADFALQVAKSTDAGQTRLFDRSVEEEIQGRSYPQRTLRRARSAG